VGNVTTNVRAGSAGQFDPLVQSDSFRATSITGVKADNSNRSSSTFFVGEKGNEIADYSYNYKQDGITVSGVSVNFYADTVGNVTTNVRAGSAGQFDPLVQSDSFR